MYFQLLKLVVWSNKPDRAPRTIIFKPGVLNVITGKSRTGKSAIVPIIDYCLASSDCYIPIDIIRDHASWYGIVFQTETEEILIARKAPENNSVSNEYFLIRDAAVSIPPVIEEPNEKTDGIKLILNTISSVPYFSLEGDIENQSYKARLGFRDLMALVFQTQDIVANQNILFYKTHAHAHRERLRNWFPFILGAEDVDILKARQRLQEIDQQLNRLQREYEKAKNHSNSWMDNMIGHLKVAREYGLLEEVVSDLADPDQLLFQAKELLDNVPDHIKSSPKNIYDAKSDIEVIEEEEGRISTQISLVKKRLYDVSRLKDTFNDYGKTIQKRAERLHISEWLLDISQETGQCPACGSDSHPNSHTELAKIASAFKVYEDESKRMEEIPSSFSREEEKLKTNLDDLLQEQKYLQRRYDILLSRDKRIQEDFQRRKNMFLFLGHLKASIETFESLGDGGEFKEEIKRLKKESDELKKIADRSGVIKRLDVALAQISQGILEHLKTLDVDEKYRKTPPKFSIDDLNLLVQSSDGNWHYLAEVGSASNWVSFHLALFCSLQEYFVEQKSSPVPSFVIFDQPSQVYFPRVPRESDNIDVHNSYENEDVIAVKSIFNTVVNSITAKEGQWQAIILDHADASIYGDIKDGIYEVEEWRDGKSLIPEEWYL